MKKGSQSRDILFSISLGMPSVSARATIASRIIGFFTRLNGETIVQLSASDPQTNHRDHPSLRLTHGALLVEALATDELRLDHNVGLWFPGHIDDVFLCAPIIPRVASVGFPDPKDRSIGGHVDPVRAEDKPGRADIEQVRFRVTLRKIVEYQGG